MKDAVKLSITNDILESLEKEYIDKHGTTENSVYLRNNEKQIIDKTATDVYNNNGYLCKLPGDNDMSMISKINSDGEDFDMDVKNL